NNVAFLRTSIELLPYFFSENEVSEIWITFPDPQMKKCRKRLTSTTFISLYTKIMQPGGIIHLKSDSPYLYQYTTQMIKANKFKTISTTDDLYHSDITDKILQIHTFYEQQWLERGFTIKYISFISEPREQLIEPDTEIEPDSYRSFNRSRRSNHTKTEKDDNLSKTNP
ncbi:MAG: tRNA (guanosine(46)-N7)-methyltransferase TrmB, partial [Bacteroidales bacterium]